MAKYRAVIIGAGRIGAGYKWHDLTYTHAGAYQALKHRIELVGFVEPDEARAMNAKRLWQVPAYEAVPDALAVLKPDVVSVCVQPESQESVFAYLSQARGIWCEKPYLVKYGIYGIPIQVNYLRRGDEWHRQTAEMLSDGAGKDWRLIVYGKDDIHTVCHFKDLADWWGCELVYRSFQGPCAYVLENKLTHVSRFMDQGGLVAPGDAMAAMLRNLLDTMDGKGKLWSPPR